MTYFVVDVEADGPVPHLYSMVSFGAVVLEKGLNRRFYGKIRPISDNWVPAALAVAGHTREETLGFPDPSLVITEFDRWVKEQLPKGVRARFISDNNGFDFGFMNYYLWRFTGGNVFGHSSSNIADLYRGMSRNVRSSFKKLRRTVHDHNPVNDAVGNAEALFEMEKMGLRL